MTTKYTEWFDGRTQSPAHAGFYEIDAYEPDCAYPRTFSYFNGVNWSYVIWLNWFEKYSSKIIEGGVISPDLRPTWSGLAVKP